MPEPQDIDKWRKRIRGRYENYLKTSFYFRDPDLRQSFDEALREYELSSKLFPEKAYKFKPGSQADELAQGIFGDQCNGLLPALYKGALYSHQEKAIQLVRKERNVVVATGTASGKTECFLYPILFELYQQHLDGKLNEPGVRALILYPMNALANDQRRRLGEICQQLQEADSSFKPTFGQYIGATPKHERDRWRKAKAREADRQPGELIFRKEMRETPPHILLTNYSMLEYLLIRPDDSPLFTKGKNWQFIVLDEAHQYRGVRGMEMGMLLRRLKQRIKDDSKRNESFRCIATSATLSSGEDEKDKDAVANFAHTLFDEVFTKDDIIFGKKQLAKESDSPKRYHLFMRALEGAFLVHTDGKDQMRLNRQEEGEAKPIEIALCRECGQHYYVGVEKDGVLREANRDPGGELKVEFYLPEPKETSSDAKLCRICGMIGRNKPGCKHDASASIRVQECEAHTEHRDQIKKCAVCHYSGRGDPVREIVHGADAPNSVIATAVHGLLPEGNRKVLAFADSRQSAAFFAWYAGKSYARILDRNLIYQALALGESNEELSLDDLQHRLEKIFLAKNMLLRSSTPSENKRKLLEAIYREMLTDEKRISLAGVGLVKWQVKIPREFKIPKCMLESPWDFDKMEALRLVAFLLDSLRTRLAVYLPDGEDAPDLKAILEPRQLKSVWIGPPGNNPQVFNWRNVDKTTIVGFVLSKLLDETTLSQSDKKQAKQNLLDDVWESIREHDREQQMSDKLLICQDGAEFRLNSRWLRVQHARPEDLLQCERCATVTTHNIRNCCIRRGCPGKLKLVDDAQLVQNHYRILYEDSDMPVQFRAEEHTAQLNSDKSRDLQEEFKDGKVHLLSSSTTFEVGVDLGDLEVVFMRNVPPEAFNYTQRAGRAGRGETPGFVITYCGRNPHDLYHYQNPEGGILKGETRAPQLHLRNEKIILRHMTAVALSAFFRADDNSGRFKSTGTFVGDWKNPTATKDLRAFCQQTPALAETLRAIVPSDEDRDRDMHSKTGLDSGEWCEKIAGNNSTLARIEQRVCSAYQRLSESHSLAKREMETNPNANRKRSRYLMSRLDSRMDTISDEQSLNFLSRNAVIPKYGFPVDVVELDVLMSGDQEAGKVKLQRDLSQAIAEYAPGSKVVANKKEWESRGVRMIEGQEFPVKYYNYDEERKFESRDEDDGKRLAQKYLCPIFGFTAPQKPKEPHRRTRREYTTRPFFEGFKCNEKTDLRSDAPLLSEEKHGLRGVEITKASPASMVVLCEGKNKSGFHICRSCGSGFSKREKNHKTPYGKECGKGLAKVALGHEFVTNVVQLKFPGLTELGDALSLAYAILLGAARTLDVPENDLNVTITGRSDDQKGFAIILYDDVPGGAGLVDSLEKREVLHEAIEEAKLCVAGGCGCDDSCYGCLRSYRNQFVHTELKRNAAKNILDKILLDAKN